MRITTFGSSESNRKLWAYIYDYRGELVSKDYLTVNNTGAAADEPQDNVDFIGRASFDLGDIPTDSYTIVVRGKVVVNGIEVNVSRSNGVTGAINSTLPPALLVFAPSPPEAGETARVGDVINIAGRVTDQTENIEAVEVRMVCNSCGAGGKPENKLLFYNSELEYDLCSLQASLRLTVHLTFLTVMRGSYVLSALIKATTQPATSESLT